MDGDAVRPAPIPRVRRIMAETLAGHGASRRVMETARMRLREERIGKVVLYELAWAKRRAPDRDGRGRCDGYAPCGCVGRPGRCTPSSSRGTNMSAATPTST